MPPKLDYKERMARQAEARAKAYDAKSGERDDRKKQAEDALEAQKAHEAEKEKALQTRADQEDQNLRHIRDQVLALRRILPSANAGENTLPTGVKTVIPGGSDNPVHIPSDVMDRMSYRVVSSDSAGIKYVLSGVFIHVRPTS